MALSRYRTPAILARRLGEMVTLDVVPVGCVGGPSRRWVGEVGVRTGFAASMTWTPISVEPL
jgi:hypothetical protein